MFRLAIAIIIGGCVLAYFGIQEFRVGMGTGSKPLDVNLAELEDGLELENNYVRISEHIPMFDQGVYEYEESKFGGASDSSKVTHMFYPIISAKLLEQLKAEQSLAGLSHTAMMIRTTRFKTVGQANAAMNQDYETEAKIEGLVINQVGGLDAEEKKMMHESFPQLDVEKVLILQEGRKPTSLFVSLAMILGGAFLVLGPIGYFFLGRGGGSPPPHTAQVPA